MPSRRSKEDTWKENELLGAIKEADKSKKHSSSSRSKESESSQPHQERKERHRDKDGKDERKEPRKHRKEEDRKERDDKAESRKSRRKEEEIAGNAEKDKSRDGDRSRRHHKSEEGRQDNDSTDERKRRDRDKYRESDKDRGKRKEKEREDENRATIDGKRRHKESERGKHGEIDKDRAKRKEKEREGRAEKDDRKRHGESDRGKPKEDDKERERRKDRDRTDKKSEDSRRRNDEDRSRERRHESKERGREKSSDQTKGSKDEKSRAKDKRSKHHKDEKRRKEDRDGSEDIERRRKDDRDKDKQSKHRSVESRDERVDEIRRKGDRQQEAEEEFIEEEYSRKISVSARKSSILQAEEVNEEEIANDKYDYEDDEFEDYDDDFEDAEDDGNEEYNKDDALDMSNSELEGVDEIRRAIREENELAGSHTSSLSSSRPSTKDGRRDQPTISTSAPAIKLQSHGRIDFIAAKQKKITDKIASRTRRRGLELSKMIEMDVIVMDFFEMKPMNVYDLYMKSFGRSNTEQVSVQTKDNDISQETQTEDLELEAKWCQFSNDIQACGGDSVKVTEVKQDGSFLMTGDTRGLNKFLTKASQVCLTLLDEMNWRIGQPLNAFHTTKTRFSEGFTKFDSKHPIIANRSFMDINISPVQTNLFLVAYGEDNESKESPNGLLCLWNSNQPLEPQKFLMCQSLPTCCCLSPAKPSFAFAGMEDGTIALWDLREPYSMHRDIAFERHEFTLRSETFTTAGEHGTENHHSPVVSIITIISPDDSANALQESRSTSDSIGMSFQIASLEELGTINIWVVVEIIEPDIGGSERDLGLIPGGKVKIIKSGSVIPQISRRSITLPGVRNFSATTLGISLGTRQNFTVGTDQSEVLRTSRFGEKLNPKSYYLGPEDWPVTATSIDHSIWDLELFLVGCTDGSVMIFREKFPSPVAVWSDFSQGAGILNLQWSRSRPGVFYVLDDRSFLYAWDLIQNTSLPIIKEHLSKEDARPVRFSLTNDLGALGDKLTKRNPELVVLYSDGCIHVYKLLKSLCEASSNEVERLRVCLNEL